MKSGKQRRQELKARTSALRTQLTQLIQANTGAEQEASYQAALHGGIAGETHIYRRQTTAMVNQNFFGADII